jgi:hypothetical protein
MNDEVGGLAPGTGLPNLGELPERRAGDQLSIPHRGEQGDDVLEVEKPGAASERDGRFSEVEQAPGAPGVLRDGD